jgi:sugar phosphate isomerase/epimerase
MHTVTRRGFLQASAAVALSGPAWAIDPIRRPGSKANLQLSLAAYSFRQYLDLQKPTQTLFDFIDFSAELPLDAVELTSYYFADTSEAYLDKLKAHAAAKKLAISGVPIRSDFCVKDESKRRADIDAAKAWIGRAARLGAQTVRLFAGKIDKGDTLDIAERAGVLLGLENHGGITDTPENLLALVKPIHSPALGVNVDTGNFRTADPYADIAAITPYGVNVQIKTEVYPHGQRQDADLKRIVQILRNANYHGPVALEYEAKGNPFTEVPKHVKDLRRLIDG